MITQCACSNSTFEFMFSLPARVRAGEPPMLGRFLQCSKCGLLRLAEEQCLADAAYEGDDYRESVGETATNAPEIESLQRAQGELIANSLGLPDGESVIDFGAGRGYVLDTFMADNTLRQVCALEINVKCQEILRAKGIPVAPSFADAAREFGPFDHAICVLTLEHLTDPWAALNDAREALRPESQFHAIVPWLDLNRAWQDSAYRQVWFCAQHRWYFNIQSLQTLFETCGYEVRVEPQIWTRADGWVYLRMSGVAV